MKRISPSFRTTKGRTRLDPLFGEERKSLSLEAVPHRFEMFPQQIGNISLKLQPIFSHRTTRSQLFLHLLEQCLKCLFLQTKRFDDRYDLPPSSLFGKMKLMLLGREYLSAWG